MKRIRSFTTALFLLFCNALWAGEINITGQGLTISDGDLIPRTADGTDFGQLAAGGGTRTHTFVIHNSGGTALQYIGLEVDGAAFDLVALPTGALIQPNNSINFKVKFDPTSAGLKSGTVRVFSNDSNESTYNFSITGEGLGNPEINLRGRQNAAGLWVTILDADPSPRTLDGTDFGNANVGGTPISKTFQLQNTGDGQLTIDSITEGNDNFSVASIPTNVGVNQTQTFTVTFDPKTTGTKNTTIVIQNNDANEDPYTFSITGEGRAPNIKVRGQGNLITNGDTTPRSQDGTNFGQVAAGGGSISKTFVIHNEGNQQLNVTSVLQDSNAFSISGAPTAATPISAGNTNSFTITLNPTSAGVKTGTVLIRSNDTDDDPYSFEITGEGLGTPEILVQGQFNGTWIEILDGDTTPNAQDRTDFANTTVGGSGKTRNFRIRNTGDAQLTIDSITAGSPHFSVANVPATVGVNQTKTIAITFAPTSAGTKNATLTIQNNDPNEDPHTFRLTGVGRAPDIAVRGQSLLIPNGDTTPRPQDGTNFGQITAAAGMITKTFVIHNDGNTDLTIDAVLENGSAFSISGAPTPVVPITAGSTASFDIIFDPTSGGTKAATVQIRSNDPAKDPYTFNITGEALGTSKIQLRGRENISSPWRVITKGATSGSTSRATNFPDTLVNGGLTIGTFEIRNLGGSQITIDSITIDSSDFVVANVPATVGVNQTQTFTIAFNPSAIGNEEATVTVRSNAPDDDPFTFTVEGLGLADGPLLGVRGGTDVDLLYNVLHEYGGFLGMQSIVDVYPLDCDHGEGRPISHGDITPSIIDGTDFGTTYISAPLVIEPAGGQPLKPSRYLRLTNYGSSDLTITGITTTGANVVLTHNEWAPQLAGQTIPAGECASLPLEFISPALGLNTATVNIISDDPDHPLYQFDITIEGIGNASDPEIEVLSPGGDILRNAGDTIDFGITTLAGQSNTRTLRLQNVGASLLQFSGISSDSEHFIITPVAEANLSAGEWVDFEITFSPTATGEHNGTVTIESNADTGPTFTFGVIGAAQGNGGTPPEPEPELVLFGGDPMVRLLRDDRTPSPLDGTDAGAFEVGDEITFTLRARNAGNAPLNFTRAPFAVGTQIKVDDLEPTLQPGEHDDFTLTFTPRNPGDYRLVLALQSDDPAGQFSLAIGATVSESPVIESAGIEITDFSLSDGEAFLSFNTPAGTTYRVVTNTDLESTWTLVEGGLLGGGFTSLVIPNGGGSERRFYRVEQE